MIATPETDARKRATIRTCRILLNELRAGCHEVVLVPARDPRHSGHKLRALQSQNADWYSRFARKYTNCRGRGRKRMIRPRTYISKRATDRALCRMIAGDFAGVYADRLVRFIASESDRRRRVRHRHRIAAADNFDWFGNGIRF